MAAVTAAIAAVGVGLSAYGAYNQYQGSRGVNEAQQQQIALEQKVEAERRKAMELKARRDTLQEIRIGQRARAMGLTTATSQGASAAGSSGLPGAYGQIGGEMGTNLLGISQNLEIGRNIFDYNSQISDTRIRQARAGGQVNLGQGLSSLGGSIVQSLPALSSLSQGFGTPSQPGSQPSYYQPGGYGYIH